MISLVAALMMAASVPDGASSAAPADVPAIEILWPVPYYARAGREMTTNSKRLELLLKKTGVPHRFSFTPVKRAFHLYAVTKAGCTPHGSEPIMAGDLISQPFASTEQWFYVRSADGLRAVDDIRTAAALEGVDRFFRPTGYEWISWQYAPTYQALVAMLKNGRVQAVTLGPLVNKGILQLPDGVVRLGDKPYVSMELRLHCRPTPEAKQLIEGMDAVLKAGGR